MRVEESLSVFEKARSRETQGIQASGIVRTRSAAVLRPYQVKRRELKGMD